MQDSSDPALPRSSMDGCANAGGERPQVTTPTETGIQSVFAPQLLYPLDTSCVGVGTHGNFQASNGWDDDTPCQYLGSRDIPSTRRVRGFAMRKQGGHVLARQRRFTSRFATSGDGDEDEDDDDDDDNNGAGSLDMQIPKGQGQRQMLACPFYKSSSIRYMSCARLRLSRIRDVKQHLIRRHLRPLHCPVCGDTFNDSQCCDSHIKARTCNAPPGGVDIEGVTATQRLALTGRVNRALDEASQWFSVWEILFPNTPRPLSPYLSTQFGEVIDMLYDFWGRQRDTLIAEVAAEVAQSTGTGAGNDNSRLVTELSSRLIEQLFSRFRTTSQTITDPAPFKPTTLNARRHVADRAFPASVCPPGPNGAARMGGTGTASNSMILNHDISPSHSQRDVVPPIGDTSTVFSFNTPSAPSNRDYYPTPFFYPVGFYGCPAVPITQSVEPLGAGCAQTETWLSDGLNMDFQGLGSFLQGFPDVTSSDSSVYPLWTNTTTLCGPVPGVSAQGRHH